MREIKFRAWERDRNRMLEQECLYWSGDQFTIQDEYGYAIPVDIMQFTGLKDKNGTDIYEGDICTYREQQPQDVFWLCGGFCTDTLTITDYWSDECEVIGNIHENSELLK